MSYKLVDLCFQIPGLKLGEQAVLMAICRHADNKTHDCYPSREVIARLARLDVRQVQRLIPILVEKGFINRTVGGKGRAMRSQYLVQVDYINTLRSKGDTTLLDEHGEEDEPLQGDNTPPLRAEPREAFGPPLGDIDDTLRETFVHSKGDIECSLNKKNLSLIGHKESVSESVTFALTPVEILSAKAEKKAPDARTKPFREALKKYYTEKAKMAMGWDEREGKQLSAFLAAYPSLTIDNWQTILEHRAHSEAVTHSQRACYWLARAADYLNSPLDRYNKPCNGENTNGNGKRTRNFSDIIDTGRDALELLEGVDPPAYLGGGGTKARTTAGQICEGVLDPVMGADTRRDR